MKNSARLPLVSLLLTSALAVAAEVASGRDTLDLSGTHWQMEGIRPGP